MFTVIVLVSMLSSCVLGGSVCSDCVSFGAVWPPPCFDSGLALIGNTIKTVATNSADECQVDFNII